MNREKEFTKLDEPQFGEVFDILAIETDIARVRAFEPELKGRDIVIPVELTKTDGVVVTLGFSLDVEHLRDLLGELDFPEIIS